MIRNRQKSVFQCCFGRNRNWQKRWNHPQLSFLIQRFIKLEIRKSLIDEFWHKSYFDVMTTICDLSQIQIEIFWFSEYSQNWSYFSSLNIHSSVRRYLRLPHSLRKSQSLLETSARAIGIFAPISSFNTEIQLEICKCAFLEHFNTGRVLCKENNRAENYYIILQGRALKGKTARLLNGDRLQGL